MIPAVLRPVTDLWPIEGSRHGEVHSAEEREGRLMGLRAYSSNGFVQNLLDVRILYASELLDASENLQIDSSSNAPRDGTSASLKSR